MAALDAEFWHESYLLILKWIFENIDVGYVWTFLLQESYSIEYWPFRFS